MDKSKERNPWIVFFGIIFTGVVFAADMFKAPPLMGLLAQLPGASSALVPWFMSAVSIIGIFLAFPAGGIMMKTGPKLLGTFSICVTMLGSIVGTFSVNAVMLIATRFVEGVGVGLIGVAAPAILAACFPPEKRGLPMSIWSCWVTIGILIIFNIPALLVDFSNADSWKNIWILIDVLFAAALIIWIVLVKVPAAPPEPEMEAGGPAPSIKDVFKSIPAWCLALLFFLFGIGFGALTTFGTTFMTAPRFDFDPNYANFLIGTPLMVVMLAAGVIIGILLNVLKQHRSMIMLIATIMNAIMFYFIFTFTQDMALAFMIVGGLVFQLMPAIIFTVAPEAAPSPQTVGLTMGLIITFQNIGGMGPGVMGSIIALPDNPLYVGAAGPIPQYDWGLGTIFMIVFGVLAVLAAIVYFISTKKKKVAA
ncbi:MAG: MFS transporter [Eggerthellaceae bacterium]|nr:MFS transporter [Eggerthellaceae bacterium]